MICFGLMAQISPKREEQLRAVRQSIPPLNRNALRDTNQVVLFAFKVKIEKQISGDYKIVSLTVSDSIAYKYYPNFDFIKNINYKLFADGKKTATFVMPMGILMHYPTKVNAGLVSVDAVFDSLIKYHFLQDEKGKPIDTSDYIYLPLDFLKTTTAEDH